MTDRAQTQAKIKELYGDRLAEATERLCHNCTEATRTMTDKYYCCNMKLLPICIDGSPCPYFRKRENAN